jgi:hypothetical protein
LWHGFALSAIEQYFAISRSPNVTASRLRTQPRGRSIVRGIYRLSGLQTVPHSNRQSLSRDTFLQQKGREPGERFFHNGAIEVDLAGSPAAGAASAARGFIGIAFRLQNGQYEYIYLRPTNGRADDQVRRNHSTQYSSHPNFSFADARQQAPEKYESYVDLESGVWTRYRIVVERTKARLYVNGASQPCLIVNDLKLSDSSGGAALWIGPGTEGYFASLKVEAAK